MHHASAANRRLEQELRRIALDHLFIDTLRTRHSDQLDLHEVSVWGVKSALLAAYQAGVRDVARNADGVSD